MANIPPKGSQWYMTADRGRLVRHQLAADASPDACAAALRQCQAQTQITKKSMELWKGPDLLAVSEYEPRQKRVTVHIVPRMRHHITLPYGHRPRRD